jgi:hypothetical protein
VTWNNQYFNQGSPKPDGSYPGNTRPATGTYDAGTGAFTLSWTSQVQGGPFDKFTGQWHLAGRFVPSSGGGVVVAPAPTAAGGNRVAVTATAAAAPTGHAGRSTASAKGSPTASGGPKTTTSNGVVVPVVAGGGRANPSLAASTKTVAIEHWKASWWLIALAIAIAVVGFFSLGFLNRAARQPAPMSGDTE